MILQMKAYLMYYLDIDFNIVRESTAKINEAKRVFLVNIFCANTVRLILLLYK